MSEPNYHTARGFSKSLLSTEMQTTKVLMGKLLYVNWSNGLSI